MSATKIMTIFLNIYLHLSNVVVRTSLPFSPRSGMNLNSVLKRYENIHLDPIDNATLSKNLNRTYERAFAFRRLNPPVLPIRFTVTAFGKNFSINVQRGESGFTSNAKVVIHDSGEKVKEIPAKDLQTNYVEGCLLGEQNSYVHGHLPNGVFTGVISTINDTFYIEPAHKYFDNANISDAIIYRESDVQMNPHLANNSRTKFCLTATNCLPVATSAPILPEDENSNIDILPAVIGKVCKVKAVADPWFYREFNRGNEDQTVASMEMLLKEVDKMYRVTDFDGDGRPDNVRVRMHKAEVYKSISDKNFLMGDPQINVTTYLELFTYYDHKGFCAALAFTFLVFKDNVLGYAFRGSPDYSGGICYPEVRVEGKRRSMNTGLVTFATPAGPLVMAQGSVLVAHELGHMFGSRHDEDLEGGACFFEPEDQHFIMSSMANPGTSVINRQFSQCSLRYMRHNLKVHGNCLLCRGRECSRGHWIQLAQTLIWTCLTIHVISTHQ